MARILVVDDDAMVVALLRYILEQAGYTTAGALDGEEALGALGFSPPQPAVELPDAVLLDLMMPFVDGYKVCMHMKNEARTRGVPLILLTGVGTVKDMFLELPNVAGFLEKPVQPQTLLGLLDAVLKRKAARKPEPS